MSSSKGGAGEPRPPHTFRGKGRTAKVNTGKNGKDEAGADGAATGPAGPNRRRSVLVLSGIAVLVVAGVVAWLLVRGSSGTNTASGSTATSTTGSPATPGAATDTSVPPPLPTPTPTGPTGSVDQLPTAAAEVPLNSPAAVGNGVVATLPKIEAIQGTATGPGNVAGPAIRVTVRIQNGTSTAVSLGGVAVNMYYGSDKTPASPLDDPSQRPFGGMLAAGQSADGVYVFTVPADQRDAVTVEVGYQAGAPLLLFTGPVR